MWYVSKFDYEPPIFLNKQRVYIIKVKKNPKRFIIRVTEMWLTNESLYRSGKFHHR